MSKSKPEPKFNAKVEAHVEVKNNVRIKVVAIVKFESKVKVSQSGRYPSENQHGACFMTGH
jgi:hypothetical protein